MESRAPSIDLEDCYLEDCANTPPSPAPSPSLRSFASLSVPKEVELTDNGTRLKLSGKIEEGMAKYFEAIAINSAYAPAYYNIAVVYSELGRYEEALKFYTAAIQHNKFYVEAYCNIGVMYKNVGQIEAAIAFYDKALAVNPNFTIAKNNMAIALTDYGTKIKMESTEEPIKKAIQYYQKALVYNFQYADAYYNLGVAYGETGEYDKAVVSYELAIHFNPSCCEAYNNLGVIYKDRDNLEKSIQCYSSALNVNPKFSQTLNNLGVVYTVQGKLEEAYRHVKAAINVNPNYAEAYNNLGVLYRDEGEIRKGLACYEKCLALNPHSQNAAQNRLLAMNYLPDLDIDKVYQAHKEWGESLNVQMVPASRFRGSNEENRVVRIGYISPDFFMHSVSYFIDAVLANHSTNFQVFCYSNVVKEDCKTHKLKQYPHCWRSIYGKGTEEVVEMILEDEIDILVELAGHTAANRLDVCLRKPAPIQVTYIGYPNTTGIPTIDYRFSDYYADPPTTQQQYTEELVCLPHSFLCYTPPTDTPPVAPPPCLKNGYITFGSFNNLAKINANVLDLWATIMNRVPNSRLLVKCKPFASPTVKGKFLRRMESRGIASSRIDLYTLMGQNYDHLSAYGLMDISLDTFPYAGTTTTCESLFMGVPVVTLKGTCHAQNVGVSILSHVKLQSLITASREEYVKVAVELASDQKRLEEIRRTLRDTMLSSYMCDGKAFTADLEVAYRRIWWRHCRNETLGQQADDGQGWLHPAVFSKHRNNTLNISSKGNKKNKNQEGKENEDTNVQTGTSSQQAPLRMASVNSGDKCLGGEDNCSGGNSTGGKKEGALAAKARIKIKGRDIKKKTKQKNKKKKNAAMKRLAEPTESIDENAMTTGDAECMSRDVPDNSHNGRNTHHNSGGQQPSSPIPIPEKGQRSKSCIRSNRYMSRSPVNTHHHLPAATSTNAPPLPSPSSSPPFSSSSSSSPSSPARPVSMLN